MPGSWHPLVTPMLRRLTGKYGELQDSLVYTVKPYGKEREKKWKEKGAGTRKRKGVKGRRGDSEGKERRDERKGREGSGRERRGKKKGKRKKKTRKKQNKC